MLRSPLLPTLAVLVAQFLAAGRAGAVVDNGKYINGKYINGKYINNASLGSLSASGFGLEYVHLENSQIVGYRWVYRSTGLPRLVAVRDVTGYSASADLVDTNGAPAGQLPIRFASMRTGSGVNTDVTYYKVEYAETTLAYRCDASGCGWRYVQYWYPMCEDGPDEDSLPDEVIPINGVWDYRDGVGGAGGRRDDVQGYTLACVGASVGKCIDWLHYKPWRTPELADAHEACVRMIRADYCGNGHSCTMDGTQIDVGDTFDPPVNDPEGGFLWGFEALWNKHGAVCVSRQRYEDMARNHPLDCTCLTGLDEWGKPEIAPVGGSCPFEDDVLYDFSSTLTELPAGQTPW